MIPNNSNIIIIICKIDRIKNIYKIHFKHISNKFGLFVNNITAIIKRNINN